MVRPSDVGRGAEPMISDVLRRHPACRAVLNAVDASSFDAGLPSPTGEASDAPWRPDGGAPEARGGTLEARGMDGLRELHPAYFALMMATGIVSIASHLLGMATIAGGLFWFNVVAYLVLWMLTLIRIVRHTDAVWTDLLDHNCSMGFFKVVAGTCVLASQCLVLYGAERVALVLGVLGLALWAVLVEAADHAGFLGSMLPFLKGRTLLFWATATWWIPMLVALGFWRHVRQRFPLRYDPLYWGAVFPLGMCTAATWRLAGAVELSFLQWIPRGFIWIALAAWLLTCIGLARSLFSRFLWSWCET